MNTTDQTELAHIQEAVRIALAEDVGSGDVTAKLCEPFSATAQLLSRDTAILCGQPWFEETFKQLDNSVKIKWACQDGEQLQPNQVVCEVIGDAPSILTGERTALNFLQTLSGTATTVNQFAGQLAGTQTKLLDTRKTIPGLRYAQKYAVRCGGGKNHRMGLYDAYLIKENHIATCGSISNAVTRAKSLHPELMVEVEVETIDELREAMQCGVDIALLDNFSFAQVASAITIAHHKIKLEVSGGITLDNINDYAQLGIDFISVGALTKHLHAIDFSMRFI